MPMKLDYTTEGEAKNKGELSKPETELDTFKWVRLTKPGSLVRRNNTLSPVSRLQGEKRKRKKK